jgi:hypothetical protein
MCSGRAWQRTVLLNIEGGRGAAVRTSEDAAIATPEGVVEQKKR